MKEVDKKKNPGLAKLPTKVRNKMGYKKKGGKVVAKKKGGAIKKMGGGMMKDDKMMGYMKGGLRAAAQKLKAQKMRRGGIKRK
jgi:hypothetical protein|tara:strand:- start:1595 stop:1843 length:249 start_codon:yes stop_codon:yes gene_type:complete